MKKSLLLLTVLSFVAVPFFCSCDKNNGDNNTDTKDVVIPEASTSSSSISIDFGTTEPVYEDSEFIYKIKSLEFTEDSRYILTRIPVSTKSEISVEETVIGKYVAKDDGKGNVDYQCEGFGTVTVANPPSSGSSQTTVTVKPEGEENAQNQSSAPAQVTDTPPPANTDEQSINRTWSINGQKTLYMKVSGNGLKEIETTFNGCDLYEIAGFAAKNGVSSLSSHVEEFKGYKVKEIQFTGNKTFTISFDNNKSIKGKYSLSTNGKNITLTLPEGGAKGIPAAKFFHGTLKGTYEFKSESQMKLSVNTTIEGYNGLIEMQLTKINK